MSRKTAVALFALLISIAGRGEFFPAVEGALPWRGAGGRIPTGSEEFDIELPRANDGPILNCADFGVSETNADNTVSLRAAFEAAKTRRASKLELKKGVYRFERDWPLTVKGFCDFTFDGHGSVFVTHRRAGCFLFVQDNVRTRLVNFSLDWDWRREPLASIVRVTNVTERDFDLEFVDYDEFPDKDALLVILSPYDEAARAVGVEGGVERFLDWRLNRDSKTRVKREWLRGNALRVYAPPQKLSVGQLYRLQHYHYHMDAFWLVANKHLQLENINILSTPGHALYMEGKQHHVLFKNVNIVAPKDDPRRVITCTADHLHINRSQGYVKVEDCEFSLGADDIFNMHDISAFARVQDDYTVRTQNSWAFQTAQKGERIELRNEDFSPSGFFGAFSNSKAVDAAHGVYDVTFEEPIPLAVGTGVVLFNWAYDTHNVIVRRCKFHDNRARGVLVLARNVTIEDCVFRHQDMGAIKLETGYTFNVWSEGYGVSNVVIRGNVFENTNPSGSSAGHRERTIYAGIYLKKDPSPDTTDFPIIREVLIEKNRFRDNFGVTAYLSSVSNLIVRDNIIEDTLARKVERPYRSQIHLFHVRDAMIVNNVFVKSDCVKDPGVQVDSATCSEVIVAGNVLSTVAASLAIPHSGVVEGFYGRPWSHEGRLGLMKFMGELGLNTYIYGPKDDPYHHAKWREPYPKEKAKEFGELLSVAESNRIDFYWAIHLGNAFTNSVPSEKETEYKALFNKLESMHAIGIRAFGIFFDDFGGTNAELHAEICNRVMDGFLARKGNCRNLIVCPNVYAGDGSSGYCRALGERCDKRIEIMWTGPNICTDIPRTAAEKVSANYRRAPFVWWNWPVNDFNRGRLAMGRMYGVDPYPFAGFVLNPMENLEASKLAIYSAAQFVKSPQTFDSKDAWEKGLVHLYGGELGAAMRIFCEHNSDVGDGPCSGAEWLAGWGRVESERISKDGDLRIVCNEIRTAMRTLQDRLPTAHPALWAEIRNWVEMQDAQAEEGIAALDGDYVMYNGAKDRRRKIFDKQMRYFSSLAPEWDKGHCTGCITGQRILQPMIDAMAKKVFGSRAVGL